MSLRVGLIQLAVGSCKKTNLNAAAGLIQKAKQQGKPMVKPKHLL